MSVYTDNGYENRLAYLNKLAEDYGVSFIIVHDFAKMLGSIEDFDALISTLEEYTLRY